jgi:ribonuclease HI
MSKISSLNVTIFSDGSSRGNPGPGGWAAVVVVVQNLEKLASGATLAEPTVIELGGREDHTTNNRMELMAVEKGISQAPTNSSITVYTDSKYVINGITKWIHGWKRNGWQTKAKEDVLNRDLWEKLSDALVDRRVEWKYVPGHQDILGNERCDHIATDFADGNHVKLYHGPLSGYDLPKILDISFDETKSASKTSDSARKKSPAYSYVSSVGGVIEVHHSWPECEKRVKGAKGARYKKAVNQEDEDAIIEEFSAFLV